MFSITDFNYWSADLVLVAFTQGFPNKGEL